MLGLLKLKNVSEFWWFKLQAKYMQGVKMNGKMICKGNSHKFLAQKYESTEYILLVCSLMKSGLSTLTIRKVIYCE